LEGIKILRGDRLKFFQCYIIYQMLDGVESSRFTLVISGQVAQATNPESQSSSLEAMKPAYCF